MVYLLTETLDVWTQPAAEAFTSASQAERWTPGLIDGDYARRMLGDRTFDLAVQTGVLVPIP